MTLTCTVAHFSRFGGVVAVIAVIGACGARTGLLWDQHSDSPPRSDASVPGAPDAAMPVPRLCAFDASSGDPKSVLAVATGRRVVLVQADGSQRSLPEFPEDRLSETPLLRANEHFVFTMAFRNSDSHERLLDAAGSVIWQRDTDDTNLFDGDSVWLNEAGVVALSAVLVDATKSFVAHATVRVDARGMARTTADWVPLSAVGDDGSIAVQSVASPSDPMTLGWLRADGSLRPLSGSWTGASHFACDGTRFVYVDGSGSELVVESQSSKRTIALPHAIAPSERPSLAGRWLAIGDLRVNLDSQLVEAVTAPRGLRRFIGSDRTVDRDGNLFEPLRDDYFGSVYRSSDLGNTWVATSGPVRNASQLSSFEAGGTDVVVSFATFSGEPNWPNHPSGRSATLVGQGWIATRPALHRQRVRDGLANAMAPVLSNDGLCAAYSESGPDHVNTLKVWDLETDRTIDVLSSRDTVAAQWIEAHPPAVATR